MHYPDGVHGLARLARRHRQNRSSRTRQGRSRRTRQGREGGAGQDRACGAAATAVAWLWFKHPLVGICVGIAMFLAISVAVILGVLVPLLFDRLGIDPAVASGPFITTTNDVLGIFIYLGLATMMMSRFL